MARIDWREVGRNAACYLGGPCLGIGASTFTNRFFRRIARDKTGSRLVEHLAGAGGSLIVTGILAGVEAVAPPPAKLPLKVAKWTTLVPVALQVVEAAAPGGVLGLAEAAALAVEGIGRGAEEVSVEVAELEKVGSTEEVKTEAGASVSGLLEVMG